MKSCWIVTILACALKCLCFFDESFATLIPVEALDLIIAIAQIVDVLNNSGEDQQKNKRQ